MVIHYVEEDDDEYNIDPKDMKTILEHARDNDVWAAPFGTVGAYYCAHFVLDATPAEKTTDGYLMKWKLPHPCMPPSIPLKVQINQDWLADVCIVQDGDVFRLLFVRIEGILLNCILYRSTLLYILGLFGKRSRHKEIESCRGICLIIYFGLFDFGTFGECPDFGALYSYFYFGTFEEYFAEEYFDFGEYFYFGVCY